MSGHSISNQVRVALALAVPALFSACSGGGSSGSPAPAPPASASPPVATLPIVLPTAVATSGATVAGTALQIPPDAYGPAAIGAAVYASADATQTTPLGGATVIVGPVPVIGATPPATLPAGDVAVTTNAIGAFTAQPALAPAPATSAAPFVVPQNNILGFTAPANGYYVEVYGATSDGRTAGTIIPMHRFVAPSSSLSLRVSTLSAAEAGALAAINRDRATAGARPLVADAAAEEIARLHAADESSAAYTCHYDTHAVGPSSRYLAIGGLGLTGEGLGLTYGPDAASAFAANEAATVAEQSQTPAGGHYVNLIDPSHQWAGVAAVAEPSAPGFFNVDYELVTPNGISATVGASGYPTTGICPPGTTNNGS